jgi:hypothetical protein
VALIPVWREWGSAGEGSRRRNSGLLGGEPEPPRGLRAQRGDVHLFLADAFGQLKPVQVTEVVGKLPQPVGLPHDDVGRLGAGLTGPALAG